MYYPIQIPYILNKEFSKSMEYTESTAKQYGGFVICFWEMQPLTNKKLSVENVIVADACIDIVVLFDEEIIGFAGMSKTEFHFKHKLPNRSFGARLMPGAFHQLTRLPATEAMDIFLPLDAVFEDFDKSMFFSLDFEQAKEFLGSYLYGKTSSIVPDTFTMLFNTLSEDTPATAKELYELLNFSPRQCQRLFEKHFGISPKMALSIVRFQKCLEILTSPKAKPADLLNATSYYDQPHFINDFKRNIGLTPLELINIYRK